MTLQTNLYDQQIYFGITYQGYTTLILEPYGWADVTNHILRDASYWGFWADFIEDNFGLTFTYEKRLDSATGRVLTGGGQLLQDIYERNGYPQGGSEAEVYFSIGYMISNTQKEINSWRINLNEYENDYAGEGGGGVKTSIEKMPFQAKLLSRFTAPCTVNTYSTMDGALLTPISAWTLRLHSKTLLETSQCITQAPLASNQVASHLDSYLFIQPDQSNLETSELAQVFTQPMAIVDTASTAPNTTGIPAPPGQTSPTETALDYTPLSPFTKNISQYNPATSGVLSVSWQAQGTFYYWHQSTDLIGWEVTPRVVVQRLNPVTNAWDIVQVTVGNTKVVTENAAAFAPPISPTPPISGVFPFDINLLPEILPGVTGAIPRANAVQINGWSINESFSNISVLAGDCVYVHCIMCPAVTGGTGVDGFLQLENYINQIKYTQLTVTPSSSAPAYRAFDVITQMLENITGQKNALISNFFSPGGRGYKFLYTNGYAVRNYGANIYLPVYALKNFIDDRVAEFGLGVGMKIIDGVQYMVIEDLPHFMQNRTIATFSETFQFKDIQKNAYCYNKVELGFNKWQGLNILQQDEFCTDGSYLLQFLKLADNVFQRKSNTIYSGYLSEEQRRNQFVTNPGQTLTNDLDWFGYATSEPDVFSADLVGSDGLPYLVCSFSASTSAFAVNLTSMALQSGDVIQTTAGTNSGTKFTIVGEYPGYPIVGADVYYVTPTPANEIVISGFTVTPPSPNEIFAERNQPFAKCTGVIDPTTIYNGRMSMKHILYNWRPLLGVGLYFLDLDNPDYSVSQIVTTLTKMNSLFTSQFLSTETNKGYIGDLTTVEIAREWVRDYLHLGSNLFSPIGATCKAKMGWNEMNLIRMALCGETGNSDIDFGGLELRDNFGKLWFCHVMDIQYNFVDQMATLQVQKVKQVVG